MNLKVEARQSAPQVQGGGEGQSLDEVMQRDRDQEAKGPKPFQQELQQIPMLARLGRQLAARVDSAAKDFAWIDKVGMPQITNNEQRFIVDREVSIVAIEGVYQNPQQALYAATSSYRAHLAKNLEQPKRLIKITSDLYTLKGESLLVTVPDLTIEPKEKGGEATIEQSSLSQPTLIVDLEAG